MGVGNGRAPVLGVDEPLDVLHRAGAVEGNHRRDVAQVRGLQFLDVTLHPRAFQLEQVGGVPGGQQLEGWAVVQGQRLQVYGHAAAFLQQLHGAVEDGEVGQPQEVHFEQAQVGHRVHGELGHEHRAALVASGRALQGHRIGQGFVGNQHPGGVGADVVHDSLQPLGLVDQGVHALVLLVGRLHLRAEPQRVVQRAGLEGHQPGDAVHVAVAHAQGAANVPQRGLGAQGAEGDYLRHPVVAVALDDVVQHLVPPVVLEVQVDVGHLLALQVEEPLEDQAVLQRVHVGDAQAVEGHAGGGAAPHAKEYVPAAHEVDDVPHHQEVVGELGVVDDLKLVAEPLLRLPARVGVAAPEPFLAQLGQVLVGVHAVGGGVAGQVGAVEVQLHAAHIGHQPGGLQGLPEVREELLHFLRTLDVVGVVLHPQPLFVLGGGAGLDADVNVLQARVGLTHVVGVVGDDQREFQIFAKPH